MRKGYVEAARETLRIDADFEGGSLGRIQRLGENYYFMELRPDTTYQFSIRLTGCRGRRIVISFRCRDYKPELSSLNGGNRHYRWPERLIYPVVSFDGKNYREVDFFENDRSTFDDLYTIVQSFDTDVAYLASGVPYLYSTLMERLDSLPDDPRLTRSVLGLSRNGVEQPLLTFTLNPSARRAVWLISREDADEATGSYAAEGLIDCLLSGAPEIDAMLREHVVFFAPMIGVDGVIAGSYHSAGYGYGGRLFHRDDAPTEIANVKNFSRQLAERGFEIVLAGKIHGEWSMGLEAVVNPTNVLASTAELRDALFSRPTEDWHPGHTPDEVVMRDKGYFERFIVDELGVSQVFGCHVGGSTPEGLRRAGRDLMLSLVDFIRSRP